MSWSLNIGSIAGTQVRVHVTFLLFLGWIFAASWVSDGSQAAWAGLAFMVLLFACVLAHEFGHIFTARLLALRRRTSRCCRSAAWPGSSAFRKSRKRNC